LSFLDDVKSAKREAVETHRRAGTHPGRAGSGKTRVITFRIAYLIEKIGVMPEAILAMTFITRPQRRWRSASRNLSVAQHCQARDFAFHSWFCVRGAAAGHRGLCGFRFYRPGTTADRAHEDFRQSTTRAISQQVVKASCDGGAGRQAVDAGAMCSRGFSWARITCWIAGDLPAVGGSEDGKNRAHFRGVSARSCSKRMRWTSTISCLKPCAA